MAGDGYDVNWHVPIDDTNHWKLLLPELLRAVLLRLFVRLTSWGNVATIDVTVHSVAVAVTVLI